MRIVWPWQVRSEVVMLLESIRSKPEEWMINPYNDTILRNTKRNITVWSGPYLMGMCRVHDPVVLHFTIAERRLVLHEFRVLVGQPKTLSDALRD